MSKSGQCFLVKQITLHRRTPHFLIENLPKLLLNKTINEPKEFN